MRKKGNILIVDDSADGRLLLHSTIEKAGNYNILTSDSAMDAFEKLGMNKNGSNPNEIDIILMDIMMPEIDGIEACRRIKSVDALRDIPVIMVTASDEVENLKSAFSAGAIDYITKPLNRVELLARMASILELKTEMDKRKAREEELMEVTRQLEEANKILRRLSSIDGLTNIANRRFFDEILDKEWRRALRDQKPLSLIMFDIDFFKKYNDGYGHQMGDDCLKKVAQVLSRTAKRPGDLVARYGGEEFAVILPNTELEQAKHMTEMFAKEVKALRIPHGFSEVSEVVTISGGLTSMIPTQDSTPAALIQAADEALYRAKREGRDKIRVSTQI